LHDKGEKEMEKTTTTDPIEPKTETIKLSVLMILLR